MEVYTNHTLIPATYSEDDKPDFILSEDFAYDCVDSYFQPAKSSDQHSTPNSQTPTSSRQPTCQKHLHWTTSPNTPTSKTTHQHQYETAEAHSYHSDKLFDIAKVSEDWYLTPESEDLPITSTATHVSFNDSEDHQMNVDLTEKFLQGFISWEDFPDLVESAMDPSALNSYNIHQDAQEVNAQDYIQPDDQSDGPSASNNLITFNPTNTNQTPVQDSQTDNHPGTHNILSPSSLPCQLFNPINTALSSQEEINPQHCNVFSLNVMGASTAKQNFPAARRWVFSILSAMQSSNASIGLLQDLHICERSTVHDQLTTVFRQCGFHFTLHSFTDKMTKSDNPSVSKTRGRGVAIILPIHLAEKGAFEPAGEQLENEIAHGYYLACSFQATKSLKITALSVYSPPNHIETRRTIMNEIEKIISHHQKARGTILIIGSDSNSIYDPDLDSSSGEFKNHKACFTDLMKQLGCIDSFRLCNPNASEYTRISTYLAKGHEIKSSMSRIDHIHIHISADNLFRIINAAIDTSATIKAGIHSDHFPTLASISISDSEPYSNVEYEIENEEQGFNFKEFVLDCRTADLSNTPTQNHPSSKIDWSSTEEQWKYIASDLTNIYAAASIRGEVTKAERKRIDDLSASITSLVTRIHKIPTKAASTRVPTPQRSVIKKTHKISDYVSQKAPRSVAFAEAFKIRAQIQCMLCDLYTFHSNIRSHIEPFSNQSTIDVTIEPNSSHNQSHKIISSLINKFNKTVASISEHYQDLSMATKEDQSRFDTFTQDNPKRAAKINHLLPLGHKSLTAILADINPSSLKPMPSIKSTSSILSWVKEAIEFRKTQAKSIATKSLSPDDHQDRCHACKVIDSDVTVVKCDGCPLVFHPECCNASLNDSDWFCPICSMESNLIVDISSTISQNASIPSMYRSGQLWVRSYLLSKHMVSSYINKAVKQLNAFYHSQSFIDRLTLISENSIGKWFARVFPKIREQPDPLFRDPSTGLPLKNRQERLNATAELHRKFSSSQGHQNAFAKEFNDTSGRTMVCWVQDEAEFESRLSNIANQYRAEGISQEVVQEIIRAEQFIYNNLKPGSAQRQWSEPGIDLPSKWPNHPLTELERESILNGKINKQRVNSFLFPAIKWFPKVIQDTFWTLLNISIEFCVTPHSTKLFLRLAIPKKILGDFRHLAIPDDIFSVIATTLNNRINPVMNRVCSDQICSFLQGRSPMDANAKRNSVREDAFQALQEGHDHPLFITMTDDMKMYDSVNRTLLATACMVMGAPEGLLRLMCENMYGNHFFVHTTEGPTCCTDMEIGLRQGDVKACFSANLVNQTRIIMLSTQDVIYKLKYPPSSVSLSIHELGFFYCDDQEQYSASWSKLQSSVRILGFFSLAFKMGIHGLPKSTILHISKHTYPESTTIYAWDRSERTPVKKQIAVQQITQDMGTVIGSSLGYVVSTGIDTTSVQSKHVVKRVMGAASRISSIKMKLTSFEQSLICMSVGRGTIGYDPITGLTDKDARICAKRFISIMAKSYSMGYSDRKGYITAPASLGGAATPHLMGEWLLSLSREVSFYLNHDSIAATLRQSRFIQAYIQADKSISLNPEERLTEANVIKQRTMTLAQNGIIIRDYYNPISARLLDLMNREDTNHSGIYNWTNTDSAPPDIIQKALKWYEFSNIAVHLRRCMQYIYDQTAANSALKEAFKNIEDGLGHLLSSREQKLMLQLLPNVFEDISQEWNLLKFSIKVNVGSGEDISWSKEVTIEAPIPQNLISHGKEGLHNIDRARKHQYDQISRLFPSINIEQCEVFTDGSQIQGNATGYAAIFAIPDIAQNTFKVIASITAQCPEATGWYKISNNFGELSAIITAAELIRHRSHIGIYTDSMVSIHTILNSHTKKVRHQYRSPFFNLSNRAVSIIKRCQQNAQINTITSCATDADQSSTANVESIQSIIDNHPECRSSVRKHPHLSFVHIPSHQQAKAPDPCSAVVRLNELADQEAHQSALAVKHHPAQKDKCTTNHLLCGHRFSTTIKGYSIDNSASAIIRDITSKMSADRLISNVKRHHIIQTTTPSVEEPTETAIDSAPTSFSSQRSFRLQREAHKPEGFYIDPELPPAAATDSSLLIKPTAQEPNKSDRPYHNVRTFQGNLAKALIKSSGFNMCSKQSHIINTLRWYIARLHTRQIRFDQELHSDYSKVLAGMGVIHRHQSQFKIEDPAEICPLCLSVEDARRGCQRHIMTECRALIDSRKKILFQPIERAIQELLDSGTISSTSIEHQSFLRFTPDQDLASEFPNLANLRLLLPCYDQDGFVPTDDNIPTEMYSYCGIISNSIISALSFHLSPVHTVHELNRKMKGIHQYICHQIERFLETAKTALQSEYSTIRKKAASLDTGPTDDDPTKKNKEIRSSNSRKRRRKNNRSGNGPASKRSKVQQSEDTEAERTCTHTYCEISAAAGINRNIITSSEEHCEKCLKVQWIDRTVKETFHHCCSNNSFCSILQSQIKPNDTDISLRFNLDHASSKPHDKSWRLAVYQNVTHHISSSISAPRFFHHCECLYSSMRSLNNKGRACCIKCSGILPIDHSNHHSQPPNLCTRCLPRHSRDFQPLTNSSSCPRCIILSVAAELSRQEASSIEIDQLVFPNTITFHRGNVSSITNIWQHIVQWCNDPNQQKWFDCIQYIMNAQWPPAAYLDQCLKFDNVWGTGSDIPPSPSNLACLTSDSMIDSTIMISALRILTDKDSCFNPSGAQFSILSPLAAEEWCTHPAHFIAGNRSQHTIINASSNPITSLSNAKLLFVPFTIYNTHWITFCIDYRAKEVIIFDPLHEQNRQQAEIIKEIWMNLADFILTISSIDKSTTTKYNTVKTWPTKFAHNDPQMESRLPKQVQGNTPALGCAIHCIVFVVNSIREMHTPIDDLQAFKLRHLIKFIIETASPAHCSRRKNDLLTQAASTSNHSTTQTLRDNAWQDEFCSSCGLPSSKRQGDLIACDAPQCSHVYHIACVINLPTVLQEKWLCPFCN